MRKKKRSVAVKVSGSSETSSSGGRSEALLIKKNAVVLGKADCSPDTEACQIVVCVIRGYPWRSSENLAAGVRNTESVSSRDFIDF